MSVNSGALRSPVVRPQKVQVFSIVRPKKGVDRERRRYLVKWRVDGRSCAPRSTPPKRGCATSDRCPRTPDRWPLVAQRSSVSDPFDGPAGFGELGLPARARPGLSSARPSTVARWYSTASTPINRNQATRRSPAMQPEGLQNVSFDLGVVARSDAGVEENFDPGNWRSTTDKWSHESP